MPVSMAKNLPGTSLFEERLPVANYQRMLDGHSAIGVNMRINKPLLIVLGLMACLYGSVPAQEKPEPGAATGRVLEIVHTSLGPSRVGLSEGRDSGFWTSNIPHIKGWKSAPDTEPTRINFSARLRPDGKAEVRVSAFVGKRFGEDQDLIGTYVIGEGETISIRELERYGYEAIPMKLVTVTRTVGDLPTVVNKTKTLQVAVSPALDNTPAFILSMVNNSQKSVAVVDWNTKTGDRMLFSGWPHGEYGEPLILGAESHSIRLPSREVGAPITLYIEAVVFTDGSYEGNPQSATDFAAGVVGTRTTLTKIIAGLRNSLQGKERPDIDKLVAEVDADPDAINTETMRSFRDRYPSDKLAGSARDPRMRSASEFARKQALAALRSVRSQEAQRPGDDLVDALKELAAFLEQWLGKLPK